MMKIKSFGREVLRGIPHSGYDALSKHKRVFNILTTSKCNGGCNDCHTRRWMITRQGYDLSLGALSVFLQYTRDSGYHFDLMSLSGGDPSLWSNLNPGVKMIRESGLFDRICVVTNGIAYLNFKPVVDYLDYIRVSRYIGNEHQIKDALNEYGSKVQVIDQTVRHIPPTKPIPDSLPASCHCEGWSLSGTRIWACNAVETLLTMLGMEMKTHIAYSSAIKIDYLKALERSNFYNMPVCAYCIGNDKVYNRTPTATCRVGEWVVDE